MKRALDEGGARSLRLDVEIPDVQLRVPPIAGIPHVLSIDETGVETPVAPLTPTDVQNEANKRVYRAHEWGKNVFKQADQAHNPFDDLPEEVKQVILSLGYAKAEMAALGQFADTVAEGQRLQLDYVPPLLPSEQEERTLRAVRFQARKVALAKASSSLRQKATRMREAVARDKAYYAQVRELRKTWTLQIAGGAKFMPVLSVVCAATYGLAGQDSFVPLSRSPGSGSIAARVPLSLRPRLCINKGSAWPHECPTPGAEGVKEVHALLSDLMRSVRSKVLFGLLTGSVTEAQQLPFASIRADGGAISALLIVKASITEIVVAELIEPERTAVTLEEVFSSHLLAKILHQHRLGLPMMFGQRSAFLNAAPQRLLSWMLGLRMHELFHKDATSVFLQSGLSFVWGGTDFTGSDYALISNAYFRGRSRVVVSLVDAVQYHVDGVTRNWAVEEVAECVRRTMQSK